MHNKKIKAGVAALALGAVLIGGTYAWFTSTDTVENKFQTGSIIEDLDKDGNGVEIWEEFEEPKNVVPGDTDTKLVQVQNTTTYDSFIRVRFEIKWDKDISNTIQLNGKEVELVQLNFENNLVDDQTKNPDGKWYKAEDGWYYYMGKVAGGQFTNPLLESVTLSTDTPNDYRGLKYTVNVIAESIQADNDAHDSEWSKNDDVLKAKLDYYETLEAGGNDEPVNSEVKVTEPSTK